MLIQIKITRVNKSVETYEEHADTADEARAKVFAKGIRRSGIEKIEAFKVD